MRAAEIERAMGPRRAVRYAYLVDAWPQAKTMDPAEAVVQAPAEVVIAALTREVENYGQLLGEERARANEAAAVLERICQAGRILGELLGVAP